MGEGKRNKKRSLYGFKSIALFPDSGKGTKHTYVLTIKMNAIKITVEDNMEGWTDDSDSDINVEK